MNESVIVGDAALTPISYAIPNATEGAALNTIVAHFTDANPNASVADYIGLNGQPITIHWGDGQTSLGTVQIDTANGGGFDVVGSHTYADENGSYTVSVDLQDKGGAQVNLSNPIAVNDAALTPISYAIPNATEGASLNTIVAHFTDANPNASVADYIGLNGQPITIHWGDGQTSLGTVQVDTANGGGFDVVGNHTYADENGSYTVSVDLQDKGGAQVNLSNPIIVNDAALTAISYAIPNATEGASLNTIVAHFTDANPNASVADYIGLNGQPITIHWGDGQTSLGTVQIDTANGGGFDVVGSHTYADENSSYTVSVDLQDKGGAQVNLSNPIAVNDAALTAISYAIPNATEGAALNTIVLTSLMLILMLMLLTI